MRIYAQKVHFSLCSMRDKASISAHIWEVEWEYDGGLKDMQVCNLKMCKLPQGNPN